MSKNLVRTQMYLDPRTINIIKDELKSYPKISLAQYIRTALDHYIKSKNKTKQELREKRLELAGAIKSDMKGREAINHNDIYNI